ncbi:MAG: response regulator [Candidatus Thiodiazotropha sp. (ex Epidulcina cf. delphinae)]|nr:response regulator [Candidatus Thiodiazotropha sp. (ex Epidulcina cf. delphinae)]
MDDAMVNKLFSRDLRANSEYQQALLRLLIWLFCTVFVWLGTRTGYYPVDVPLTIALFGGYFVFFLLMLISIVIKPALAHRTLISLVVDISSVSLIIVLAGDAISPFYLLYHWIYISYGTRYGKRLLTTASILSFSAYNLVLLHLHQWQTHSFDAFFFVFLLVILPLYQYSLLRRLHHARQEAERAKKARGDFLATMTHELRTPLIGVMGMARLLQATPLDAEQKEYLHSIRSSAQLLRSLISDVLDVSKIDANKLELASELFDIRELVKNVTSSLAAGAQEKQLEIYCWVDPGIQSRLYGDKLRISQILFNLLGNAIKFTDSGHVSLRVCHVLVCEDFNQPHILIEIEDSGIGIPQEEQKRIFEFFWQADPSNSRRFEGAGLGTTVVRDFTRLMGGRIEVSSEVGEGSLFSVRLPLRMENDGECRSVEPPLLRGKRILIFECDPLAMQMHLNVAHELGMQVFAATDLSEFSAKLKRSMDVVLVCDSLVDALIRQAVRCLDALDGSPPVLLAGYRGRTPGAMTVKSKMLVKPFLADDLSQVIIDTLSPCKTREEECKEGSESNDIKIAGINVLLAEDNAIAAKVLSTLLRQRGHQVRVTKNGSEALQAVAEDEYELAFIDLRMPHVDGIEFTRQYRSSEAKNRYMPIYALTANTVEDMMDHCLQAGMDGFLTKPVEPEILDVIINRYSLKGVQEQPLIAPV